MENLPSYKKPPVVETAISVQFEPIKGLTNAHLGLYWSQQRKSFPHVVDAEPIQTQVERFGQDLQKRLRLPTFRVVPAEAAVRLQMISEDDRSMVQVQNGRLVFNWRSMGDGEYPRWETVRPSFDKSFDSFKAFLLAQDFPCVEPNQWEVTYVNHLVRGRDWAEPSDWPTLLPGVIGAFGNVSMGEVEHDECKLRFVLPENRGRLHVEVFHAYTGPSEEADEIMLLNLTARGGIIDSVENSLGNGLELGHRAIVLTFTEITGPEAHLKWERVR